MNEGNSLSGAKNVGDSPQLQDSTTTLQAIATIGGTLAELVQGSIGPLGSQKILVASDNEQRQLRASKEGNELVQVLLFSPFSFFFFLCRTYSRSKLNGQSVILRHPVAALIARICGNFHASTGDGAFIVYRFFSFLFFSLPDFGIFFFFFSSSGSCSLVLLIGELLKEGVQLVGKGFHPTTVQECFVEASKVCKHFCLFFFLFFVPLIN
jgi:chaperonin GroEL (HSP60 family)